MYSIETDCVKCVKFEEKWHANILVFTSFETAMAAEGTFIQMSWHSFSCFKIMFSFITSLENILKTNYFMVSLLHMLHVLTVVIKVNYA